MYVPSPDSHAGDLTKPTNLAGYIDRHYLPGKIYQSYYGFGDNEGLLSTIPAVATALLGVLAGQWLISNRGRWIKAAGLGLGGLACLGLGIVWGMLLSGHQDSLDQHLRADCRGLEPALACAVLHDHRRHRLAQPGRFFFVVIGVNAITIYVASRIIPFPEISQFLLRRSRSPFRLVRAGASGDRNPGRRMAAVTPSLPEPDFLAGLERGRGSDRLVAEHELVLKLTGVPSSVRSSTVLADPVQYKCGGIRHRHANEYREIRDVRITLDSTVAE